MVVSYVLELLGAIALIVGVGILSIPIAFITGGFLMFALGLFLDLRLAKKLSEEN
jgi:hypothetical protein